MNAMPKDRKPPPIYQSVIDAAPEGFYRWHLEQTRKSKATAQRVGAAHELLDGFCSAVLAGKPIPKPILEYLCYSLLEYLDQGVVLDKALRLNPPRSRPRGIYTVEPPRAVATLYLHMRRDGCSKTEALRRTCEKLGLSQRNLERLDKQWNLIRDFDVAELEHLAQPIANVKRPARKLR